jgi:glycerol-3-phosphate dehydrogenase (NAD(P)+)
MTGTSVGVIGAGAWGTALAQVAAQAQSGAGSGVRLWLRDGAAAAEINRTHANDAKLPGVTLAMSITATAAMVDLSACRTILMAVPAQTVRGVMQAFAPHLAPAARLVITAKGFERGTAAMMSDVITATCPKAEPLVLSGPSFADDVVRGLPTAVTLAATTLDIAAEVADAIGVPTFRLYLSDDLVGAQVGGAVKNVLAIACGIVAGKRMGDSARAALIARAFAELNRIGRVMGARPETLGGLSGLGDLVLSCSSVQSRNYRLGVGLGEGRSLTDILGTQRGTSEGAFTACVVLDIARRHAIEVPIVEAVNDILDGRASIDTAIGRLLQRPTKSEF